jgi:hypothetical protein
LLFNISPLVNRREINPTQILFICSHPMTSLAASYGTVEVCPVGERAKNADARKCVIGEKSCALLRGN